MKKDRDTVDKFGGLIDTYTITRAVEDKAVVPLLYEGRHVVQRVDSGSIDSWFDGITENLTVEQRIGLKKKFATTDQLIKTEQKVMRTAWDISEHFRETWQGTPFKAQIVAPDKATALLYKKHLGLDHTCSVWFSLQSRTEDLEMNIPLFTTPGHFLIA